MKMKVYVTVIPHGQESIVSSCLALMNVQTMDIVIMKENNVFVMMDIQVRISCTCGIQHVHIHVDIQYVHVHVQ